MAERIYRDPAHPSKFEDRYRLYPDESGDHVFRDTEEPAHRYLCLLSCWFRNPDYLKFHEAIEGLKSEYLPRHPIRQPASWGCYNAPSQLVPIQAG